jgi:dTDP-4-dehydrorhamnose 3,5-epimerase-like enzyme
MDKISIYETSKGEIWKQKIFTYPDHRGELRKVFNAEVIKSYDIKQVLFQSSLTPNTRRGFHCQKIKPEAKFAFLVKGGVRWISYDREEEKFFSENLEHGYIYFFPAGLHHGSQSLEHDSEMLIFSDQIHDEADQVILNLDDFATNSCWADLEFPIVKK